MRAPANHSNWSRKMKAKPKPVKGKSQIDSEHSLHKSAQFDGPQKDPANGSFAPLSPEEVEGMTTNDLRAKIGEKLLTVGF